MGLDREISGYLTPMTHYRDYRGVMSELYRGSIDIGNNENQMNKNTNNDMEAGFMGLHIGDIMC